MKMLPADEAVTLLMINACARGGIRTPTPYGTGS